MMGKLIKNEIKGNYKLFIIIFTTTLAVCLAIFTRVGTWQPPKIFITVVFVNFIGFFIILLLQIKSFIDELYEDRAYLTFTLPVGGKSIVGAKLIVALLYIGLFLIMAGILGFQGFDIMISNIDPIARERIHELLNSKMILLSFILQMFGIAYFLLQIYFSVTISKMTLKGKKIGKLLGFIIFIALVIAITWLDFQLRKVFQQTISWNFYSTGLQFLPDDFRMIHINIAEAVFNIAMFVTLFMSTSYFLEKKLDLS